MKRETESYNLYISMFVSQNVAKYIVVIYKA